MSASRPKGREATVFSDFSADLAPAVRPRCTILLADNVVAARNRMSALSSVDAIAMVVIVLSVSG